MQKIFLVQFCEKTGKLLKGREPDFHNAAKIILNDWQRGKLPYFVPPPTIEKESDENSNSSSTSSSSSSSSK